jgi:hypothetical protein
LLATLQGAKYQQNVEKQCVQIRKAGGQWICRFFHIFLKKKAKISCFSHLCMFMPGFAAFSLIRGAKPGKRATGHQAAHATC